MSSSESPLSPLFSASNGLNHRVRETEGELVENFSSIPVARRRGHSSSNRDSSANAPIEEKRESIPSDTSRQKTEAHDNSSFLPRLTDINTRKALIIAICVVLYFMLLLSPLSLRKDYQIVQTLSPSDQHLKDFQNDPSLVNALLLSKFKRDEIEQRNHDREKISKERKEIDVYHDEKDTTTLEGSNNDDVVDSKSVQSVSFTDSEVDTNSNIISSSLTSSKLENTVETEKTTSIDNNTTLKESVKETKNGVQTEHITAKRKENDSYLGSFLRGLIITFYIFMMTRLCFLFFQQLVILTLEDNEEEGDNDDDNSIRDGSISSQGTQQQQQQTENRSFFRNMTNANANSFRNRFRQTRFFRYHSEQIQLNRRRRREQVIASLVARLNRQRVRNGENPISPEILSQLLRNGWNGRDYNPNDYDMLLQFNQENGEILNHIPGLTEVEMNRFPSKTINDPKDPLLQKPVSKHKSGGCSICLEPYELGDEVRTIPCFHTFCKECIDQWLKIKGECPICKFPVQ